MKTKEHPDLYRKSIKGGFWVIAMRVVLFVLGFVKSIIIANFFILENLGLIAIAAMMMGVLTTFTQTGFETALIQKKADIKGYLNTAWTAGVIKGVFLFLVLYSAAPLLASIQIPEDKVPLAVGVLRAMSFCFLINGVRNIGIVYFQKDLDFRKVFTLNVVTTLTNIILSLSLIYILKSLWGVIAAQIIAAIVNCTGTYVLSPYRPRLHFEPAKARELWKFGKWIYGQSILGYTLEMGDKFFVWFALGLPQLALYKYAYNFANMPATEITGVISTVSFPAYSKIQDDIPRLREAYLKILQLTATVAIPVSFMIFVLGPDFVKLFLKEHLHPMTIALQILAIKGLLKSTGATRISLFKAIGKPYIVWHLQWSRLVIMAVTIYPLTRMWGITGTALSVLLINIIINPGVLFVFCRVFRCSIRQIITQSALPLFTSVLMGILIFLTKQIFTEMTISLFFVLVFGGLLVYLTTLYVLDLIFDHGLFALIREQIKILVQK